MQINKIYLVKLLISNIEYDDGATRTTNRKDKRKEKNIAIIYLNNKKGITEKSPKESQIVYFNLPESDFSLIQNNLINFSKNTIKVEIYNRVEYFYRHKGNPSKEILIP